MSKENKEIEAEIINATDTNAVIPVDDNEGKDLISESRKTFSSSNLINYFESEQLKKQLPEISKKLTLLILLADKNLNQFLVYQLL